MASNGGSHGLVSENGPLLLVRLQESANLMEGKSKLSLNETNLNILLNKVGSRPLSIFSIMGSPKTGKSLVFGFMVKYLTAVENDNLEWIDWENPDQPLEDFKWPDGESSPLFPGIWCFNRPFILKSDDGFGDPANKEVAVLLLYAQQSAKKSWSTVGGNDPAVSALMGLTIHASSCTIFNVSQHLDENCLLKVSEFIKHAMQAVPQKSRDNPFQSAAFLVRDWNFPTEFPYGTSGGKRFVLSEKLQEKPAHSKESRISRQLIKAMSEKIIASLLPFPGSAVVKSGFKGSVAEMESLFVKNLGDFVTEVISLDELPMKKDKMGRVVLSASQWKSELDFFIKTCNHASGEMNTRKILSVAGVQDVTLLTEQKEVMKSALNTYAQMWKVSGKGGSFMKETELMQIHKSAKKSALEAFRNGICPDEDDDDEDEGSKIDQTVEAFLKKKLEEKLKEVKMANSAKLTKLIDTWKTQMVEEYEKSMGAAFPEERRVPSEKEAMRQSEEVISGFVADFSHKFGTKGKDDLLGESEKDDFYEQLKKAEDRFLNKLFGKRKENDNNDLIELREKNRFAYEEDNLQRRSESRGYRSSSTLSLESSLFRTQDNLMSMSMSETLNIPVDFVENGNVSVNGAAQPRKEKQSKIKQDALNLIAQLKDSYTSRLKLASQSSTSVTDLEKFAEVEKIRVIGEYHQAAPFSKESEEFKDHLEILEDDLKSALVEIRLMKKKMAQSEQLKLKESMKESVARYERKLSNFLMDNVHATRKELEDASNNFVSAEIRNFSISGTTASTGELKVELEKEMLQVFEKQSKNHAASGMLAVQQSKNLMGTYKTSYMEEMKAALKNVTSEKTLKKKQAIVKGDIIQEFKESSNIKDNTQLLNEQAQELDRILKEAFENEVKTWFHLKLAGESGSAKLTMTNAQVFYQEGIQRCLQNEKESILDADLVKMHEKVCAEVFGKCENLEEGQKKKLKEELELTFQKYRVENSMNMNVDPVIGIDLGTTFSCVSVFEKGAIQIIPNSVGKYTTPSYVFLSSSGEEIVGEEAKTRAYEDPESTIFDAKRILGRRFDDPELQDDMKLWPFSVVDGGRGVPMIEVNGKRHNPEMISAKILEQLKKDAEAYLKRKVTRAVITVPAYFTDGQKQATIDAGKMAFLTDITILNEPVAAAMAYELQCGSRGGDERHILIFDLGGGTFDVAVLKTTKGKIEVLTVDGNTHLGGEDFDKNLMNHCAKEFKKMHNIDLFEGKDSPSKSDRDDFHRRVKRLQEECEKQKIALTTGREVTVKVAAIYKDMELSVTVKRATFEKMNAQLFMDTIQVVKDALKSAKLEKEQINDVVLVGGSTRIPKIQRMLKDFFEGKELDKKINPDEAVAHGAGLMAAIRKGNITKESAAYTKIQDVTPMPLGVEVYGGEFSTIIPKNTKIPVKLQERYKTSHKNQTSVQITVYEGLDPIAVNNKHLGDFYLNGIPPNDAGVENIDVEMVINDQGILHVTAKCSSTGAKSSHSVTVTENKMRMGEATIQRYLAGKTAA